MAYDDWKIEEKSCAKQPLRWPTMAPRRIKLTFLLRRRAGTGTDELL